ncbi:MAG: 23S rRNA (pseudouridine(1915)-N(3))-methyltransferase RlmH [Streptococcaceae bacterium]|jgi:23S rRNA (pseudouridine1915-N3)-methyltransferase|nr:23S rRNA (pseudouridine(1915)-N(3))-methyltransferase RlmH [Streptococcaceae bacterium]
MQIKIITVGKLKEKYLKDGIAEYQKRLGKFVKIELIEVPDEKAPERLSESEMVQVKQKEAAKLLAKINPRDYLFALAINGNAPTSEDFAEKIRQLGINGQSNLAFVIGGSLGLSDDILKRANATISFGKLTYPHQLMRLILIEQIYRAQMIINGSPYHK